MKNQNRIAAVITTMSAALFVFVLVGISAAQGRYTNQYSRADVDNIIRDVEDRADEFRRDFYSELDRANLGSQERSYRNYVTSFENATDRLRRNFDSDNTWWRSRNQVQNVISSAMPLNNTMNTIAFRRRIERQWNQLRNAVNRLADTYDLPGIAGGGWNGGGPWNPGNPNDRQTRPPSWAQGTFYGTAPDGTRITLTISNNGRVTANIGGSMNYGSFLQGNNLRMNEALSRVTRQGDGLVTTRTDNGERIVYRRGDWNGGGGNDDPGDQVAPPSWARGTFYGRAPDGTRITLTIRNNGEVTASIGGSINYGRFIRGNLLRMNEALSRVERSGNGFSTTRTDNGEVIYYTR